MVTSDGGHLTQMLSLRPWWEDHDRIWVGDPAILKDGRLQGDRVIPAAFPVTRNLQNAVKNLILAAKVILEFKPHAIISSGAGVAVPFYFLGRLTRVPCFYIEVFDRIDSVPLTGRIARRMGVNILLQWEEQAIMYPEGTVVGPLL